MPYMRSELEQSANLRDEKTRKEGGGRGEGKGGRRRGHSGVKGRLSH